MRKTKFILDAIAESKKKVTYCAVDLAHDSLIQVPNSLNFFYLQILSSLYNQLSRLILPLTLLGYGVLIMTLWIGLRKIFLPMLEKSIFGWVPQLEI